MFEQFNHFNLLRTANDDDWQDDNSWNRYWQGKILIKRLRDALDAQAWESALLLAQQIDDRVDRELLTDPWRGRVFSALLDAFKVRGVMEHDE